MCLTTFSKVGMFDDRAWAPTHYPWTARSCPCFKRLSVSTGGNKPHSSWCIGFGWNYRYVSRTSEKILYLLFHALALSTFFMLRFSILYFSIDLKIDSLPVLLLIDPIQSRLTSNPGLGSHERYSSKGQGQHFSTYQSHNYDSVILFFSFFLVSVTWLGLWSWLHMIPKDNLSMTILWHWSHHYQRWFHHYFAS